MCARASAFLIAKDCPDWVISRGQRLPSGVGLGQNRILAPLRNHPHSLAPAVAGDNRCNLPSIDPLAGNQL